MLCSRGRTCLHLPPMGSGIPGDWGGSQSPWRRSSGMCCRKNSWVGVLWKSRHALAAESRHLGCRDHWCKISGHVKSRYLRLSESQFPHLCGLVLEGFLGPFPLSAHTLMHACVRAHTRPKYMFLKKKKKTKYMFYCIIHLLDSS